VKLADAYIKTGRDDSVCNGEDGRSRAADTDAQLQHAVHAAELHHCLEAVLTLSTVTFIFL
jgi:hypothetical protein